MDGSQLLLKTDFPEARKGYDKAQVDDFLRALSEKVGELKRLVQQATQRAEAAEAKLVAAAHERTLAEQARAEVEAALRGSEATRAELALELDEARAQLEVDEVEVATGVLAMAKRTAEATVDEAVQRAHRLLEDAEVNAAVTQLEAEQRAERTRREMEEDVELRRRRQLDVLEAEVAKLSAQRDALEADVVDLQDFMDGERRKLRDGVDALARLLDVDGPLVLGRQPALTATPYGGGGGPSPDPVVREPGSDAERRAMQIPQLLEGPTPEGSSLVAGEPVDDEPAAGVVHAPDGTVVTADPPDPVAAVTTDPAVTTDATVEDDDERGSVVAHDVEDDDDGADVIDLTDGSGRRHEAAATEAAEAADEPVPDADEVGSPLGRPRAEADTAMREFFEPDDRDERRTLRRRPH
jgi:DivIVA domain-containing protein